MNVHAFAYGGWLALLTIFSLPVSSDVGTAEANPVAQTWQQLAAPPYVLTADRIDTVGEQRRFLIEPVSWTEWHIPAPGVLALRPLDDVNPNEALEAFMSNGSGLLAPVRFVYDADSGLWVTAKLPHRTRLIHVRARRTSVAAEAFRLERAAERLPIGDRLAPLRDNPVAVSRHTMAIAEPYTEVAPGAPMTFPVSRHRALRIRIRLPFDGIPRSWQDHQLTIEQQTNENDAQVVDKPRFRAVQDKTRSFLVDGVESLLAHREDHFVVLPDDAREMTLKASHRVYLRVDEVLPRGYLLPTLNHRGPTPATAAALERSLIRQRRWQQVRAIATDNLLDAAPLAAAAALRPFANGRYDMTEARFLERVLTRHTDLLDLLPRQRRSPSIKPARTAAGGAAAAPFDALYAEYRMPRLLPPEEKQAARWMNATQLSSAANRAAGAWFSRIGTGETFEFPLPDHAFTTRARIVVNHQRSASSAPLDISFGGDSTTTLFLDRSRIQADRHDPADGRSWTRGFARMPADVIAGAEIDVPAGAASMTMTNRGPGSVLLALQVRVPKRHQHDERDWIDFLAVDDSLLPLWWRVWETGSSDRGDATWSAQRAYAELGADVVNGWIPLFHYLSQQVRQFEPRYRVSPVNMSCEARGATSSPEQTTPQQWQSAGQWINANEAWQRLLPTLAGDACRNAHQRFALNLLALGEHSLAEDYWRALVRESPDRALVSLSLTALDRYYTEQDLPYARVRLHAHRALTLRDATALADLADALLDAGHDRFGVEVAMLTAATRANPRLQATLIKLGWHDLLNLLGPEHTADPEALAELTIVRRAPLERLSFGASVLLTDRLFDTPSNPLLATPAEPAAFRVEGPIRLRVSLRPLTHDNSQARGWAIVKVNGARHPVPITAATQLDRYATADRRAVGPVVQAFFDLEEGIHDIEVHSSSWALATAIHTHSLWLERVGETTPVDHARVRVLPDSNDHSVVDVTASRRPAIPAISVPQTNSGWQALLNEIPWEPANARQLMAVLTYVAAHDGERRPAAIARGEWLASVRADDRGVSAMRARLRQASRWSKVQLVERSAGVHLEPMVDFAAESPYARVRNLFLPAWRPGEQRLSSGATVTMAFETKARTQLRLSGYHASLATAPSPSVEISTQHNGKALAPRSLGAGTSDRWLLELSPGDHQLELTLGEFAATSVAKLLVEHRVNGAWQPLQRQRHRRYRVADSSTPLEFAVRGPAWVRIDELAEAGTLTQHHYLSDGEPLPPLTAPVDTIRRYRGFVRTDGRVDAPTTAARGTAPVAWPERAQSGLDAATPASLPRPVILSRRTAPTYSASLGWFNDDEAQEDARQPVREYWETAISRRQRDARLDRFAETTLLGRARERGSPSFGATYYHWRRLEQVPFSVRASGRAYGQSIDSRLAWSSHGDFSLRHFTLRNHNLLHRTELKLFGRFLSEDKPDGRLDPDIFTSYMNDHRHGLEIGHRVSSQRYWDSELYGDVRLRSNEFPLPTPDYFRINWGGRAQLGAFQVGAELQATRYFRDDDRAAATTIPRLKLRGRWYGPRQPFGRIELRGEFRYDLDDREPSGTLRLLWHLDRGQGLDDFHGERHWFDDLLTNQLTGAEE